jgi:transcription elongation factor GreA-like protein
MTANPREPRDFISDLENLEDLLCHHITNSKQSPELFTEQVVDILKNVLSNDRTSHWSTKSFMRDLREEYALQSMLHPLISSFLGSLHTYQIHT